MEEESDRSVSESHWAYESTVLGFARASSIQLKERPLLTLRIHSDDDLHNIYNFHEELGRGNFGIVIKVTAKDTGIQWAMKILHKSSATVNRVKLQEREIKILRMVQHPHIIHLEKVFESRRKLYLIFELCTGPLAAMFNTYKPFNESDTRVVMRSLASAVNYLHRHDIVHRDLKLENILLARNPDDADDKLYIKVTDFGLSVVRGGVGYNQMLQERCGTMIYMAPELLSSRMYTQQCDVWAMGVIMFLLMTGDFPFNATNSDDLEYLIKNREPDLNKAHLSVGARRLIRRLLTKDPAFRITAAEVTINGWILEIVEDNLNSPSNVLELMNMFHSDNVKHQPNALHAVEEEGDDQEEKMKTSSRRRKDLKRFPHLPPTVTAFSALHDNGVEDLVETEAHVSTRSRPPNRTSVTFSISKKGNTERGSRKRENMN